MKTSIKPKQLLPNYLRTKQRRIHWAGLALALGLLNLALAADPDFTRQPTNLCVSLGATATFRVYVGGTPPLGFQWHYTNSGNSFPLDGVANPSALRNPLNLTNVQSSDAGGYFIVVTNAVGSATSQVATLTVDPTFIKITKGRIVTDQEPSVRASWCDYDGDGFQDLFVANQGSGSKNSLYHNNGDGTFTKITTNALSATAGSWSTGAWADVDNDGDPDLYVGGAGSGNRAIFYRNDGNGRFTAVPIVPTRDAAGSDSWMVAWGDYDQDGWVDLFIPTPDLPSNRLFRNLGDLNFKSMTAAEVGDLVATEAHENSPSATWIDYDNDGDLDIYVVQPNRSCSALYLNSGTGFFTQTFEGSIANVCDPNWDCRLLFWADYDNNGYLDVFVNWPGFAGSLHRNLGGTNSVEVTDSGLEIASDSVVATWGDYDNDGNLDLFIANNPRWPLHSVRGANLLFRNNGDGTFREVDVGSPIWEGSDEWDPSWIDYDNDGFLDLFIAAGPNVPEVNYLYRNNLRATGNTNHWLKVNLVGKASNASGIGAKVRVTANIRGKSVTQMRTIESPGHGGSNQSLLAHFGLGDATKVDTLRVEWPSGIVQEWKDVAVDQHLTKVESQNPPPPQPQITASGHAADGTFQATVACAATNNVLCVFEASTNLAQWTKLSVRTNTSGTVQFDDPGATNRPERFYRVLVP